MMKTQLKRITNKLRQSKSGVKLVFPHVPKCGGQSVVSAISESTERAHNRLDCEYLNTAVCDSLSQGDVLRWLKISSDVFAYQCLASRANIVIGHAPLLGSVRKSLPLDTKVVTLLREPVSRWISNYVYDRYKIGGVGKHSLDIESYLVSGKGKASGQYYARFFASSDGYSIEENVIDEAVSNLVSFDLVGDTSDMSAFTQQLEILVGVPLKTFKTNSSPNSEAAKKIRESSQLMKAIKSICQVDCQIYRKYQVTRSEAER